MDGESDSQQDSGEPQATVEDGDDGRQDRRGRECARMKVLVGERDADARHRKRKQDRNSGHGGPLRLRLGEAATSDPPATVEEEEDGGELPEQDRPRQRQMAKADRAGDEFVEDGGLKLQAEEFRVVRKQGRVQIALDRGQVKRVVLKAWVVSHDEEGEHGERGQQQQIRGGEIVRAQPTPGRVLRRF